MHGKRPLRYYVGCAGWRNVPWKEQFYPRSLPPADYLSYYSRVFDFVEVNLVGSSQNNAGAGTAGRNPYASFTSVAKKWHRQTGSEFRFAIGIPESVLRTGDEKSLGRFLGQLDPVEEKVLAVLLSVPPQMTLASGRGWLDIVLATCTYHGYSAAVQFAHASWYQDLTYNILKKHGAAVVWSDSRPNTATTSDFLYLRLSGGDNHGLWVEKLREVGKGEIKDVIVVLDSPAHANSFLITLGLPERTIIHPHDTSSLHQPAAASKTHLSGVARTRWTGRMRIIMCVDLNAFYPSCEELRDPSLRGKAHAVIMTDQKAGEITKGVVSSCSYEARKFGVRSAMSLSRALSLCPHLILRPVDIPYYSMVSRDVMAILEEYADGATIEQASIDEAFLDCTHVVGAAADPEEFAQKIKNAIKDKCGLLCSVGVAPTKSAAKIASDFRKPDGLTVVYPEDLKGFLDPLEVGRVSGIGNKTQETLKEMGIQTLGQLARADVQMLTARFGKNGYWMWTVACGTDDEPVVPREGHVSLSSETTLDVFTKDRSVILQNLYGLVDELYERAKRHGYLFRTVGVKMVRTDFSIETRESSYGNLQDSRESIASLIEVLLARFTISEDRPAVRKVGLKISHLVRKEKLLEKRQSAQKSMLDYY